MASRAQTFPSLVGVLVPSPPSGERGCLPGKTPRCAKVLYELRLTLFTHHKPCLLGTLLQNVMCCSSASLGEYPAQGLGPRPSLPPSHNAKLCAACEQSATLCWLADVLQRCAASPEQFPDPHWLLLHQGRLFLAFAEGPWLDTGPAVALHNPKRNGYRCVVHM